VAYEAGRDGFWLARWLRQHDVEAYVIHPTSVAVSREHQRAKTDRLDTERRAATVKGGRRPSRSDLPLTVASTAAG
jgi:transposase